jgi:hypothetical protein
MKRFWVALGGLGFVSGAAFLVFWLLAWTGLVPLGEPSAVSLGLMLLVTGLFSLRGAAGKAEAERGRWKRSNVRVGRLSALGFGVIFCAIGAAFLGSARLPEQVALWLLPATVAGAALILVGQSLDVRRARAGGAPGQPDDRGAGPGAAH